MEAHVAQEKLSARREEGWLKAARSAELYGYNNSKCNKLTKLIHVIYISPDRTTPSARLTGLASDCWGIREEGRMLLYTPPLATMPTLPADRDLN